MKWRRKFQKLFNVLDQLESTAESNFKDFKKTDHYGYIPYSLKSYLAGLEYIFKKLSEHTSQTQVHNSKKFLEVGAGLGIKSLIAAEYFSNVTAIEYQPHLLERAQELGSDVVEFIQADALQFDYFDYDVIFLFRPIQDEDLEAELEERIFTQAKAGTFIFGNGHFSDFWIPEENGSPYHKRVLENRKHWVMKRENPTILQKRLKGKKKSK